MIDSLALFILTALLLWLRRSSQRLIRRMRTEGPPAYVVVREFRREAMRYYAYVEYPTPDGTLELRRLEYPREEEADLGFSVGQTIEVVCHDHRLYFLPHLQGSVNIWLLLAAGSFAWALIQLYNAFV